MLLIHGPISVSFINAFHCLTMYLPTYLFKVCLLKNGVVGTLTHTDWLNCQLPTLVARSQCCKGSSNKSQVSSTVMDNNRQAKSPKKNLLNNGLAFGSIVYYESFETVFATASLIPVVAGIQTHTVSRMRLLSITAEPGTDSIKR